MNIVINKAMKDLFISLFQVRIVKYVIIIFIFNSNSINAFELGNGHIYIEEVLPLFNIHVKKIFITDDQKKVINPKSIDIPDASKLGEITKSISIEGFIGETVFKDIIIKTAKKNIDIELNIKDISSVGVTILPRIVTNWYQAGLSTKQEKFGGELTYELLLSDDRNVVINDKWIKSKKGGWVYIPPEIKLSETLKTSLSPDSYKRILLKISLSQNVLPGIYKTKLEITKYQDNKKVSLMVPISIDVKPVKLSEQEQKKYKLLLFTAFKLNDQMGRKGAYVNTFRMHGTEKERNDLLLAYLADIKEHGFNGITIHDWDQVNLEETLKITQQVGFKYVVLHATLPVSKKYKGMINPSVSTNVKSLYDKYDTTLYYYGYDEVGGNTVLEKQLKLNNNIHNIGGKSVNAVFWDDLPNVIKTIGNDKTKCFDVIAYSMGSHGQKKMFKSLPYKARDDYCSKQGTEYLTYWHPNVENPILNRIFSGFWLWASGFNGVIPHGYYFPAHIERVLSKEELKHGVTNAISPYDDWSFWMPGSLLRHHNSVYPSKGGPITTLQWEGVLNGFMDLKYILTLEGKLKKDNIDKRYKEKIIALLDKIRSDVLQLDSVYMSDNDSIIYLKKLEAWKKEISILLLN
ncbi:MAG: hypothetical protein L3J75_13045 [Methylococcaceae bacterium]|nr:hypothetical protein [Methylococcaceae bacterium]